MFRIVITAILGVLAASMCMDARAAGPRYDDIMPASRLRPGMKGYGLTVFRGTRIERFDVTVVGVVKKGNFFFPGHDAILIRMAGGPMTERKANLIAGMSGSPIYVNGKVIGAFSMGESTSKEPLGYATPIEDMLEAWDPKLPTTAMTRLPNSTVRSQVLDPPIFVGDRRIAKIVYNVPLTSGLRSHDDTLVLHPCTTFAFFSGLSQSARAKVAKALEPYNVEVMNGGIGGQRSDFKGAPLVPGSAFCMMLVTGDFALGANGTVSYRRGNRMLGFGHPFMGIGPIAAPLASAYIYDVQPLLGMSHKIFSPGPEVGTSAQDRNFAVSGTLGTKSTMIPITTEVNDLSTGRRGVFHSKSVTHPNLYPAMVSAAVESAIAEIHNIPGGTMARITTTVDAEEVGKVTRSNTIFSMGGIDSPATADLDDLLGILTSNPFYPIGIRSASIKVDIESGHRTALIDRVFVKEGKFEPGETAEIGVVIRPYKQQPVTRIVKVPIPANTPSGRHVLQVRGGAVSGGIQIGNFTLRPSVQQNPDLAPPVNVRQMVSRYAEREKNNDIIVRILLPTSAVNMEGERLSNLPPSLDAIMRSAKSSAVRLERDEVKQVEHTDWVVSGQQVIAINVQRKEIRETPAGSAPPGIPPVSGQPVTFSNSGRFGSGAFGSVEDDAAISTVLATELEAQKKKSTPTQDKDAKNPAKETPITQTPPTTAAPTTVPSASEPTPTDKPVTRAALVWRQTSRADFGGGTSHGVSVTSQGDLRLAPSLKRVQTSTESFIWSMVPDGKGGLFLGTGTQGKVLRADSSGQITIFAKLPELSVHSLLLAPDGTLWAATAPNGRTYRISPTGTFSVAHQAPEKYALALARDSQGSIYIGTGGSGNIYRIAPDGKSSVYFKTAQQHVLALTTDASDNLYAGTSTDGLVYKIQPGGKGTVLYDSPEQSITALAVNAKGYVYAGTAPRGIVYKIDADGTAKTMLDKAAGAITSLHAAPGDVVYTSAGSAVYGVHPDDTVLAFENRLDVDILSLAVTADGTVYAGTGNVAELYAAVSAGNSLSGSYESVVHDAKQRSNWGTIRWNADIPPQTRVELETRTGGVADPDSTWSEWSKPRPSTDGGRITSPPARFIQYRVTLSTDKPDIVPSLRDIAITYLPKNQPPRVAFQAPAGGERWANKQTVKWDANDPDKDTLAYELFYSIDNGAHWEPLPGGSVQSSPNAQTVKPAESSVPAKPLETSSFILKIKPPSVADVTAELDRHPDLPASLRDKIIEQTRTQIAEYESQTNPSAGAQSPTAASPAAPTRDSSRSLDTKTLPDGVYRLKVVATDRPSNATDSQTAQAMSESFVICNSAPTIYLFKDSLKVEPTGVVTIGGSSIQKLIAVTAVQCRVDGGDWQSAVPADGIFDSQVENFAFSTSPLSKGSHTIEVKAYNAASLQSVEKLTVEVK